MLDWLELRFFNIANDLTEIFFSRFPKFFEFTQLPIGEIIDKLPPFGFGILQAIGDLLSQATGISIQVPEFTIVGLAVDLLNSTAQAFGIIDFDMNSISLYAFILGYGAIIISVLTFGRWLYKFFD